MEVKVKINENKKEKVKETAGKGDLNEFGKACKDLVLQTGVDLRQNTGDTNMYSPEYLQKAKDKYREEVQSIIDTGYEFIERGYNEKLKEIEEKYQEKEPKDPNRELLNWKKLEAKYYSMEQNELKNEVNQIVYKNKPINSEDEVNILKLALKQNGLTHEFEQLKNCLETRPEKLNPYLEDEDYKNTQEKLEKLKVYKNSRIIEIDDKENVKHLETLFDNIRF